MDEKVTMEKCHEFRREIFSSIFPRWALVIAGGLVVSGMCALYGIASSATKTAQDSAKSSEILAKEFSLTVSHIKENQMEMKVEQREQRILLQKIDRRLNGGR